MPLTTRRLTAGDLDQSFTLGVEGFGTWPPSAPRPSPENWPGAGRHYWGTFDGDQLVAQVLGREYHSWFGGTEVATNGIAAVTVVAERRGAGLLDDLFRAVLAEGRERGEVISTLYPTAPGIYRKFGYELITSYDAVKVPTSALAAVRPATGVRTRRATAADFDAVRRVYDTWAAAQNGPLTRRGASFPATAEDFVKAFTGVTLAEDDTGAVVGYASWQRGEGYDASSTIEVKDLLSLTPDGYRALWRMLGSFASVTGHVRVWTSGLDVSRLHLPTLAWHAVEARPYMLRIDDVVGAFAARQLGGAADVPFSVTGDLLGTIDGDYRLRSADGATTCERAAAPAGSMVFTPHGLALAWSGAQSCANLRMAGHLTGGTAGQDAVLDTALGGRQVHVRDYF